MLHIPLLHRETGRYSAAGSLGMGFRRPHGADPRDYGFSPEIGHTFFYPHPFSRHVKKMPDGQGRERSAIKCVKIHAMGSLTVPLLEFLPARRKM